MGLIETVGESVGLDFIQGKVGDIAGHHLNADPYFHEQEDGGKKKLKAPPGCSDYQAKKWKEIRQTAWNHDRCCCGCFWADCGIGMCPLVCIIPVIGPIIMWAMRGHIVTLANELGCPQTLQMKMNSNILMDFLLALIPVLGPWFAWLNGCSTRNAAMAHKWLTKDLESRGGWVSHGSTTDSRSTANTAKTGLGTPVYTQTFDGGNNGGYNSHRNAQGSRDMRQPKQNPPPPQNNPYHMAPPPTAYQTAAPSKAKGKAGQSGVQHAGYY